MVASAADGARDAAEARSSRSYREILRTSAVVGGSQVLVMALTVVRTKAIALLLGPAGVGLMGLYSSILDLTKSLAAVGINSSGVRQIAASVGSNDDARIARTITALRRTALVLAALGALCLAGLAGVVSTLTFGDASQVTGVTLLALALALSLVADAQLALLQGTRRIGDLARVNVLGALLSTPAAVAMVVWLGEDGVVAALGCMAGATLLTSWWFSRRVAVADVAMSATQVAREAGSLLRLGAAFMLSGLMLMGAAYAVRTMIVRIDGIEGAGFFQAAWALGGLYVGLVTQAMSADFCPRLTGIADDREQANVLMNEQSKVSLLLAGPGILATLTFAPLLMTMFYSGEFVAASELLRWICLGMAMRIVSWPVGYVIIARGDRRTFILTEAAWTIVNLSLSWLALTTIGLEGAGVAFFASYLFHAAMVFVVVGRQTGFRWTSDNWRIAAVFAVLAVITCAAFRALPWGAATLLASLLTAAGSLYSLKLLATLVAPEQLPGPVRRVLALLGRRRSPLHEESP